MKIDKKLVSGALLLGSLLVPNGKATSQDISNYDGIRKLKTKKVAVPGSTGGVSHGKSVDFMDAYNGERKNTFSDGGMNIHYRNDEGFLSDRDSSDLRKYFDFVKNDSNFNGFDTLYVEGYTDLNGDDSSNVELSSERANSVANYLLELDPSLKLKVGNFGEVPRSDSSEAVLSQDRVVKIKPTKNNLEYLLKSKSNKGNIFFLDQSGSTPKEIWSLLRENEYPDDVYAFSRVVGHSYGWANDIKKDGVFGQTNYFEAKPILLSDVNNADEITTVLNGKDNCGGSSEDIINSALSRNIKLSYIAVDLSEDFEKDLKEISHKTGGTFSSFKSYDKMLSSLK